VSSSRADLKGILASAVQAAGEAQAACSIVTNGLDIIDRAIESLAEQQQVAAAMTIAAIGADSEGAPSEAQQMLTASSRLGELIIDLREGAALLRMRSESAHRIAGHIAANGTAYSGRI
jgi:uncharacterized membrane protein YqiK